MGYKSYSDSYLMSLTKAQIIELLRVTEHNFLATEEALNNSAKAGMEIAKRYDEAKLLLKAAVEDLSCGGENNKCTKSCKTCTYNFIKGYGCRYFGEYHWRYADEALALIGKDTNAPATATNINVGDKKGGWISCEDRLPEEIGCYLVVIGNEMLVSIDIAEYSENRWHKHDEVLYWQPLPDYPEALALIGEDGEQNG